MIAADAGREEDVRGLIDVAVREHGGLDIFFANAGISGGLASIFEQTPEDWQEILRVNLIGPFLAIKHAAPVMKERGGGSIICTASVAGIRAGAGGPAYSASKSGVISLVEVAATQLCGANIRVNAICPGLIETGMTQAHLRHGPRRREGGDDRPSQSAEARRRCPTRSPRPRSSSPRTSPATSTATLWSSTAAFPPRTPITARNMDARPFETPRIIGTVPLFSEARSREMADCPRPAGGEWPEFASRAEAMAFWQGVRRGVREAGRDRAHPHMPESFSLDLTRDGAAPTLTSAKLLDPWPYIADDEASQGLTSHGPAEAAPRADRADGFTVAKEQLFLRTLADTGVVADACRATGISRQAAYDRRRSAAGRAFAIGWDAALLIARNPIGDDVMSRARHGVIDRVYRKGELVAERHRYDNRLTMAVLTRLDRLAEGHGENAPVIRAVAQEFDQFLDLLPNGLQAAEEFVAARFPAGGNGAPAPVREPPGCFGGPSPSGTEKARLARLGHYQEYGVGLPEEIETDDLLPEGMESWTEDQLDRAEASGFLKMLDEREWPEAARHGAAGDSNGMCKVRQLYRAFHPAARAEPADDFAGCSVWETETETGWLTDFPPPAGFDGFQVGEPGEDDYRRELAPEELAPIAEEEAFDREERALRLVEQEAARRRFFGLEVGEPAAPRHGEDPGFDPGTKQSSAARKPIRMASLRSQ